MGVDRIGVLGKSYEMLNVFLRCMAVFISIFFEIAVCAIVIGRDLSAVRGKSKL